MIKPIGTLGALAAGALAMFYLDPQLGAQRRAQLADLVRSGLPGGRRGGGGRRARHAYLRPIRPANPQDDAELRDRIQARMDRMVSHPRAVQVDVEGGVVRLSGRVLVKERDGLLAQVQQMPGVHKLLNAMTAHDNPQEIAQPAEGVSPAAASQ